MSYVRFQAPADAENPVKSVCEKLRAANVPFSGVKLDRTALELVVVNTSNANGVKQVFGLQPS